MSTANQLEPKRDSKPGVHEPDTGDKSRNLALVVGVLLFVSAVIVLALVLATLSGVPPDAEAMNARGMP